MVISQPEETGPALPSGSYMQHQGGRQVAHTSEVGSLSEVSQSTETIPNQLGDTGQLPNLSYGTSFHP